MGIVKLENWSVVDCGGDHCNFYQAPEQISHCLFGEVYGHPLHKDGKRVRTSPIKFINGKYVVSTSGTEYELGKSDETYVSWCVEQGVHVPTEEEPIRCI